MYRSAKLAVGAAIAAIVIAGCGGYTEPKPGQGHHEAAVISRFCSHSFAEVKRDTGPSGEATYEAACE